MLDHRCPADPVDQLEPLVESGGGLSVEEVWRDNLMPGTTQLLGSEEFSGAQAKNGVEKSNVGHQIIMPHETVATTSTFKTRSAIAGGKRALRYDRRPHVEGDVPLALQASDAIAAAGVLRERFGDVPVGLWGFSQGAWAAPLAAALYPDQVSFLALVSGSGVSPAAQMR